MPLIPIRVPTRSLPASSVGSDNPQVRVGAENLDLPAWMRDYIAQSLQAQLVPTSRMYVDGQADNPNPDQVLLGTYGECTDNDGNKYTILIPYDTSAMLDEYDQIVPGSPGDQDDVQRMNTGGTDLVLGRSSLASQALPYLSGGQFDNGLLSVPYGLEDLTLPDTTVIPAPGAPSAIVKKPHVTVATGDGTYIDDSGYVAARPQGKITPGNNIVLAGVAPTAVPGVALAAGAGLVPFTVYQYAISYHDGTGWSVPGPSAPIVPFKTSDETQCQVTATWNVGGSLPTGVTQLRIVRGHSGTGDWLVVSTTSSPSGTLTDAASDGSLTALTSLAGTDVAVADWQQQIADVPTDSTVPSAPYAAGFWPQRMPLTGYDYTFPSGFVSGLQTGALHLDLLHEDHKADIRGAAAMHSDGSIDAFGLVDVAWVDWGNSPPSSPGTPAVSRYVSGLIGAESGILFPVSDHAVTDADIIKSPYLVPPDYQDGMVRMRHDFNHEAIYFRAGGQAPAPGPWWRLRPIITATYAATDDGLWGADDGNVGIRTDAGHEALEFRANALWWTAFTTAGGALKDGANFSFGTSTGTQIGTAAGQRIGFYGATPIVQRLNTAGAGATASGIYGAAEQAMLNDVYSALEAYGLLS